MFRAQLQAIEANQEAYHNHLIRDSNQGEFKDVELDSLDIYSFYALMDYWAKVRIRVMLHNFPWPSVAHNHNPLSVAFTTIQL